MFNRGTFVLGLSSNRGTLDLGLSSMRGTFGLSSILGTFAFAFLPGLRLLFLVWCFLVRRFVVDEALRLGRAAQRGLCDECAAS